MRPVRRDDNLTPFMCRWSGNLRGSTCWKPLGLSRPVMGLLYLIDKCKANTRRILKQTTTGGTDKSLARPGRKQATATEDFYFRISYL